MGRKRQFQRTTLGGRCTSYKFILREFPSPDKYAIFGDFSKNDKNKKSFGMPYKIYEKVIIPENKNMINPRFIDSPGPGRFFWLIRKPRINLITSQAAEN